MFRSAGGAGYGGTRRGGTARRETRGRGSRAAVKMHVYGCKCERCRRLAAAICATNPDGSPFFTDAELEKLAREEGDDDPTLEWAAEE